MQDGDNLPGLSPLWLILLATCLAIMMPFGVAFIYGSEPVKASDWIGFAGNVLTAGVAAAAIAYAWRGIVRQTRLDLISREEDRIERELPGLRDAATLLGAMHRSLSKLTAKADFPSDLAHIFAMEGFQANSIISHDEIEKRLPDTDIRTRREIRSILGVISVRNELARRAIEKGRDPGEELNNLMIGIGVLIAKADGYTSRMKRMEERAERIRANIEREIR